MFPNTYIQQKCNIIKACSNTLYKMVQKKLRKEKAFAIPAINSCVGCTHQQLILKKNRPKTAVDNNEANASKGESVIIIIIFSIVILV